MNLPADCKQLQPGLQSVLYEIQDVSIYGVLLMHGVLKMRHNFCYKSYNYTVLAGAEYDQLAESVAMQL